MQNTDTLRTDTLKRLADDLARKAFIAEHGKITEEGARSLVEREASLLSEGQREVLVQDVLSRPTTY